MVVVVVVDGGREELVRVVGFAAHMPLGAVVTAMAGSGWRVVDSGGVGRGIAIGDAVSGWGAWVVGFCGLRCCSGGWHGVIRRDDEVVEEVESVERGSRAWEDAIEEADYATQDGFGGGTQESGGTQHERSGQASGGAGEAGAMASRLLESMEDVRREADHLRIAGIQGEGTAEARSGGVHASAGGPSQAALSVQDILLEWDDLSSPGPKGGVWTQEQSGASPEQAMALAEGGLATLMGASRRVASLSEGAVGMGITVSSCREGDDRLLNYRPPGGLGTHRRLWGWDPKYEQCSTTVTEQVWRAFLKFAASSQGVQCKGFSPMELVLGVKGYRRKSVAGVQRHRSSAPAGQLQRGSGGPVRLMEQMGGLARRLDDGDMARAARAGMNQLQSHGSSAPAVQLQRGSGDPFWLCDAKGDGPHTTAGNGLGRGSGGNFDGGKRGQSISVQGVKSQRGFGGLHVMFDDAATRPMADAHLGAAMMAPGMVGRKVEEGKGGTCVGAFGARVYWACSGRISAGDAAGFQGRWYMQESVGLLTIPAYPVTSTFPATSFASAPIPPATSIPLSTSAPTLSTSTQTAAIPPAFSFASSTQTAAPGAVVVALYQQQSGKNQMLFPSTTFAITT
ncbi:hypothetical protein CYMTET_40957 [Cymbomonas tetramitiformis]|uniref:Uncharacterized protein n=1 Tax=Cymbomonas tetramitiformis TaxID=36881 RepID=A0AAE0C847_9CHLO|nr:hypothetical protein CYMTET_40957 [Cymbomonas tetramitiformis]